MPNKLLTDPRRLSIALLFGVFAAISATRLSAEVIAHCGASSGYGYFLHNELSNPAGPSWEADQISGGRLILVREGENWDILFGDIVGSHGYREDGADVVLLSMNDAAIVVGAFNENYTDVFTFDLNEQVVVWTSHKTGPIVGKVAIYSADCG